MLEECAGTVGVTCSDQYPATEQGTQGSACTWAGKCEGGRGEAWLSRTNKGNLTLIPLSLYTNR